MQEHIEALLSRLPLCDWMSYPQTSPTFQNEYDAAGEVVCVRHHFDDDPNTHAVGMTVELLLAGDLRITDRLIYAPGVTFEAVGYDRARDVVVCRVAGSDPALAY